MMIWPSMMDRYSSHVWRTPAVNTRSVSQCHRRYHADNDNNKSSAIAEMARVFFVNSDHGHSRKLHKVFYGTTTLWCACLNQVVERYGTELWIHESKVRRGTLAWI